MTALTKEQQALVDECVYLRGRIITAYSQVEFILADVSVVLDVNLPVPHRQAHQGREGDC